MPVKLNRQPKKFEFRDKAKPIHQNKQTLRCPVPLVWSVLSFCCMAASTSSLSWSQRKHTKK